MCTFSRPFPAPELAGLLQSPLSWLLAVPYFAAYYVLFVRTVTPLATRRRAERLFFTAVTLGLCGFGIFAIALSWRQAIDSWQSAQFAVRLTAICLSASVDMTEQAETMILVASVFGMLFACAGGICGATLYLRYTHETWHKTWRSARRALMSRLRA